MPVDISLVDDYLANVQATLENGQAEHAAFLLAHARTLLSEASLPNSSPPLQLSVGIGLHAGCNPRRAKNEDYTFAAPGVRSLPDGRRETVGLFVLADGAGGHINGQEAARLAVHTFVDFVFPRMRDNHLQGAAVRTLLVAGVREANRAVYLRNQQMRGASMWTTMTALLIAGSEAYVASVGDSRAYLYRPGGGLVQLTRDHSTVAQFVELGLITAEEVYTHPKRSEIYRSLGDAEVEIDDPGYVQIQDRDVFLLCSDGLWEMVRDPRARDISKVLSSGGLSAKMMAERLVHLALDGGGQDNIGLVVVQCQLDIASAQTILLSPRQCPKLPASHESP